MMIAYSVSVSPYQNNAITISIIIRFLGKKHSAAGGRRELVTLCPLSFVLQNHKENKVIPFGSPFNPTCYHTLEMANHITISAMNFELYHHEHRVFHEFNSYIFYENMWRAFYVYCFEWDFYCECLRAH